jgi:hypothetical protein
VPERIAKLGVIGSHLVAVAARLAFAIVCRLADAR